MYQFIEKLHTLYGLLQDEQSKEIFQARFALDMEDSIPNLRRLVALGSCKDHSFLLWNQSQLDVLKKLNRQHKKIILYGTASAGQKLAKLLELEHIDFYGFCGRGSKNFPDGLLGKPVLSPTELVDIGISGGYYVVIAAWLEKSHTEISQFLQKSNYPSDHILDLIDTSISDDENQYFEFPALYRKNAAFIDGGCYDCGSSYKFAEWCGGKYSSIMAFEPDPDSYAKCYRIIQDDPLPNFQLINAGLSSREGTAMFATNNAVDSHIVSSELPAEYQIQTPKDNNKISISTVALDDIVGDQIVGFIKMDIEGAELDALHGAKHTILRDKPLLAICVYHLRGDVFAIMDYLHELLPEYRFLLRHYGAYDCETVLYASVDL